MNTANTIQKTQSLALTLMTLMSLTAVVMLGASQDAQAQTWGAASGTSQTAASQVSAAGVMALEGVVTSAAAVVQGSGAAIRSAAIASNDAAEASRVIANEAIRLGRNMTINSVHASATAVEITYEIAVSAAEIATTLAQAGITASVEAASSAFRFTVRISRRALQASLDAGHYTLEQLENAGELAVKAVEFTVGASGVVLGNALVLAVSPAVMIGVALNDLGKAMLRSSTR